MPLELDLLTRRCCLCPAGLGAFTVCKSGDGNNHHVDGFGQCAQRIPT